VLYELCNLRHAFDAQSLNALAMKILRGSYPPINNVYSKNMKDLITRMLSIKPSQRPTIVDVLNKTFVKKYVVNYLNECLNGPAPELSPTDVDDMIFDSLKEQAEKLKLLGVLGKEEENKKVGLGGRRIGGRKVPSKV
jgi:serine/threonine protein kinase